MQHEYEATRRAAESSPAESGPAESGPAESGPAKPRPARLAGRLALAAFALAVAGVLAAGLWPDPVERTPSGWKRRESVYVPMRDGVRLAFRVSLPPGLGSGERIPAVFECTRYGTEEKQTFLLKVLLRLRVAKTVHHADFADAANAAGYAFVAVDARGSGASFGTRPMELSREEVEDLGGIVDWIASRPWSNGKVASYGESYSGNTAEVAAASGRPALRAAAPLYPDFDPVMHNAIPFGVLNAALVDGWSASNLRMDANALKGPFFGGMAPVDGPGGGRLLREAVAGHRTIDISAAIRRMTYADDELAPGYSARSLAPYDYKAAIEASGTPLLVRVGWLDAATVNGAIERWLSYSNPQTLVIGPWSHAGWHSKDPFLGGERPTAELEAEEAASVLSFFDAALGERGPRPAGRSIRYYTFGEGLWKETGSWPVPGFEARTLYFGDGGRLSAAPPEASEGSDRYRVDFSAATGESNRWRTNLGGGAVDYPDRAAEDRKLLCYTGEPLEGDLEITGVPVVTLEVSSTASDGAFFVYLEDVAPDGRVTYLTEGLLRALHRKEGAGDPGRAVLGPAHSFMRRDGEPLELGKPAELRIALQATSVLLRKGHRIRVAVAGHDASSFERVPAEGEVEIEVLRSAAFPSRVELPVKARGR
ncbi:MAG TPA: CocE/NonD family hydrolase [Spirochaetia bacterium]|nr:CocE/NonD family hydrolase [Spirochaetia bacterium]